MMRVAFISRATLFSSPGGDTTQVLETAAGLRRLKVAVDVFTTEARVPYAKYDLLHFFNAIRPADILGHTARSTRPYVLSPIFVEYGPYERQARGGIAGMFARMLPEDTMEYLKVIARRARNGERIGSRAYLLLGHARSVATASGGAALLLPNSHSEYRRLAARYGIRTPYRVIPNGVDTRRMRRLPPRNPRYEGAVICMGRIEGRKNQLNLIRALKNTRFRLFIHGNPSPNGQAFYRACVAESGKNIVIGAHLEGEALYAAYASAKVHCLPSYFETTGLSSLEAGALGCNVVVSRLGDTEEYFEGNAWFCNPDDQASIRSAVSEAHAAPANDRFRRRILEEYSWDRAAQETLRAYRETLAGAP
jgi:glycosyltransferase involved in cell wall biosynthesis